MGSGLLRFCAMCAGVPMGDTELSRGCSRMHLLMLPAHVTPALQQLCHCKGYTGKNGSKKRCTIALYQLFSCSAPTCRRGSTGKHFGRLLNTAALTPKPAPRLPPGQPGLARPGCRSQSLFRGFPHRLQPSSWDNIAPARGVPVCGDRNYWTADPGTQSRPPRRRQRITTLL